MSSLAERIDDSLPQTQCTKCGYAGCRPYAEAIAAGEAEINRCPPGGAANIERLARLLERPVLPLDPGCGTEGPLRVAFIVEEHCIGCTKCIQACPVDAIAGAAKRMHTVIAALCTGCDLCLAPCPVDCIEMREIAPPRRWADSDARAARTRHAARAERLERERLDNERRLAAKASAKFAALLSEPDSPEVLRKRSIVEAAIARARARREARDGRDTQRPEST